MRFRLSLRGPSFEKRQEKAAATFVPPKVLRDKSGKSVPPLVLTKAQQNAARYQRQMNTTRPNPMGDRWEGRHSGVGTAFAFYHPKTNTMLGGSHHVAEDRTIATPIDPHQVRFKPVIGTAGPPVEQRDPRGFAERIYDRLQDPAAYEPRPILDLRHNASTWTDRAIFQQRPGDEPQPTVSFRPVVSWPGTEFNDQGRIEYGGPPENPPGWGQGPPGGLGPNHLY